MTWAYVFVASPSSSSKTPASMKVQIDPNIGSSTDSCTVAMRMIAWHTALRTLAEGSVASVDSPWRKAFMFETSACVLLTASVIEDGKMIRRVVGFINDARWVTYKSAVVWYDMKKVNTGDNKQVSSAKVCAIVSWNKMTGNPANREGTCANHMQVWTIPCDSFSPVGAWPLPWPLRLIPLDSFSPPLRVATLGDVSLLCPEKWGVKELTVRVRGYVRGIRCATGG